MPDRPYRNNAFAGSRRVSWGAGVAVLIAAAGLFSCGVARAQIGPGPLSRAHADLESVTKCATCHDFGARGLKCLDCHVEIRRRVEAGTGFHPRAYKSSANELDCARCHAEHRGPKFGLINLDRKSFDHRVQTGFTLEGKHREQKCESCHAAAKIAAAARSEIRMKNLDRSFLGLRRECTSCHAEPHRNQLGTDCLRCHTQDAWKPASKFNHSATSFPLTGLHQQVACGKCHGRPEGAPLIDARVQDSPAEGSPTQKLVLFKGLSFNACQSCHADRHLGGFEAVKLGSKCDGCHDTGGWKGNRPGARFSHNLAKFRLAGKHADLACGKCHKEAAFGRPIEHALCRNCHEDPHKGQFAARAAGSDCSACHRETGFKPSLFDRDAHLRSAFPLTGKHSTLRCVECHLREGRDARYKRGKLQCPACHTEPHGGEFASEAHNNRCDLCHTEAGFEVTTFSVERHAKTKFPLTGRHGEVACQKCHTPLPAVGPTATPGAGTAAAAGPPAAGAGNGAAQRARRRYRFATRTCDVCHADPHGIRSQADLACEACHVLQGWKAPLPFDHSRTKFTLDRAHQDPAHPIACIQCHKGPVLAAGVAAAAPRFSGTATQCSGCHGEKDVHGGQFGSPESRRRDCASCHSPTAWKAVDFDHDSARYALDVAHRRVTCTKCHKEQKEVGGRTVRVYRDTPAGCLKCH